MQLLLETSADNQHSYCDSLKACLVTTVTSSGPSQSTIKLVATNMIANGKLAGEAHFAGGCRRSGRPAAPSRGFDGGGIACLSVCAGESQEGYRQLFRR